LHHTGQGQLKDETFLEGDGADMFGQYPSYPGYVMPTDAQYTSYLGDQNITYSDSTGFDTSVPTTYHDVSGNLLDWDKVMYGSELEQQWNYVMPDTMTSV
jgi:hypothetical protein